MAKLKDVKCCDTCEFTLTDDSFYWMCGNEKSVWVCDQVNVFHKCCQYKFGNIQHSK